MMKLRLWPFVAVAVVPVVASAPNPVRTDGPDTVAGLVEHCRATGLTGRALADEAITVVADAFPDHSLWHLWERPELALVNHRGSPHQYNTVLLLVLRELGFDAELVHAARVRGFRRPWWASGHAWVKLVLDRRHYDACASRSDNGVGRVPFVPLSPELRLRRVTRWAMGLALVPFITVEVWRGWLGGRPVADWLYSPRRASDLEEREPTG